MPDTRRQFEVEWARLAAPKGAFRRTVNNPEYSSTSPALTFIERVIHGLRISSGEGSLSSPDAYRLGRLESLLRETAVHVRNRGVTPSNEHDVQRVMHDYLRAFFPDFSLNPSIAGSIKKFTPDCGIRGLKAAIEFKIVHSERDVPRGFSGVVEDTGGYRGSDDWIRFYAVFYQAEPFMRESHVREDLKRVGALSWTPILVNGITDVSPKKGVAKQRTKTR